MVSGITHIFVKLHGTVFEIYILEMQELKDIILYVLLMHMRKTAIIC